MKKYRVSVAGATGRIGNDIVNLLHERKFPISQLIPLSSSKSAGRDVIFGDRKIPAQDIANYNFRGDDIIFFALDDEPTKQYVEKALKDSHATIIDNSSVFRMQNDTALIVSGINDDLIHDSGGRIIANPNCCTIPLAIILHAIIANSNLKIKRASVSTYQSVSGAGTEAMNELLHETKEKFAAPFQNQEEKKKIFEKQIAFNCIPKVGSILSDSYSTEERKIIDETRKILNLPNLSINATCIRVPVFVGHGEVIDIEFEDDGKPISISEIYDILDSSDLIEIADNLANTYHTPIESVKSDEVLISRLRIDKSVKKGITLWCVSDNLHLGGSLNAVKIAENLISDLN
jgi:aspartate-semialdehyde dehydrogenase